MPFKSGFVTIIGRPNVGKSTLLNAIAGEKISIISSKPQTTRNSIRAVVTREDRQMIFIDTPGIHKPKTKLGEYMMKVAKETLGEVDVVIFMIEATDTGPGPGDRYIIDMLSQNSVPVILLINKTDLVKKENILPLISSYNGTIPFKAIIPVSAFKNEGVDELIDEICKLLPEGPQYFPEDMLTDQPEKNIAAEMIREKILNLTDDEVPHGVGVEVISFKERPNGNIIDIEANIYCEKDSHKGILIGKQGSMLKKIGTLARYEIEKLLGVKVFLQLWVKVKPDWRNSSSMLKSLGYKYNN